MRPWNTKRRVHHELAMAALKKGWRNYADKLGFAQQDSVEIGWSGPSESLSRQPVKSLPDADRALVAGRRQDSRPGGRRYLDWTASALALHHDCYHPARA
jgi:hypothetical protein